VTVRFRASARRDLDDILAYSLAEHGEAVATGYLRAIGEALDRLTVHPELGAPRSDLRPGLRSLSVLEHRAYYVVTARGVSIVRVLHKRMDAGRHL
jgi:toxin ParE1/3/4